MLSFQSSDSRFIVFSPKKTERKNSTLGCAHKRLHKKLRLLLERHDDGNFVEEEKNQMNTKASSGGSYGSLMKGRKKRAREGKSIENLSGTKALAH